ncbi:MBL fold metallo-hydrolase [Corynebacterium halotolerans]|uniref:MBL fold metallo-hydrolase n=1 Tax=Corynebacterium halotolerans TaxID=225326 RepID=UPI003CF78048
MSSAPRIITLGTAGGPRWWGPAENGKRRSGISTAVVIEDAVYLVDCGRGAATQFAEAGLDPHQLRGLFLTHLHSDHTVDLAGFLLFGWMMTGQRKGPVRVIGPGDRNMLPPVNPRAGSQVSPLFPDSPTEGTVGMVEHTLRAHSTDVTDRMLDSLRPSPYTVFQPEDIMVPAESGFDPNANPTPEDMEPFVIYRDEYCTVSATLVAHPPIAPAFAFRFDTAHGSVTISGDTAPCDNLVTLAQDTDLLLHEAIDMQWAEAAYANVDPETRDATIEHHRKSHTTPFEAGQIAAAADVGALAMHHLVPGDAGAHIWEEAQRAFSGPVVVPDDLESISFAQTRVSALR